MPGVRVSEVLLLLDSEEATSTGDIKLEDK